jgi:hypothetical protein
MVRAYTALCYGAIDLSTEPTESGLTALHVAASLGHADMVELLLLHGANPAVEADGMLPETVAADRVCPPPHTLLATAPVPRCPSINPAPVAAADRDTVGVSLGRLHCGEDTHPEHGVLAGVLGGGVTTASSPKRHLYCVS